MPRADWSFLESLLEEGQEYSTAVGRVWLTILFLLRMLVLGTAAESAWDDEQDDFVCNTRQPGCTAVCYDRAFPISHFRYFVLQVILVSTPTIFYFAYVAMRVKENEADGEQAKVEIAAMDSDRSGERGKEKDGGRRQRAAPKTCPEAPKLKGRLLAAYACSILLKIALEAGFIAGLWFLYGGFFVAAKFECTRAPCPHTVDCFVSRPTEKTILTFYTELIAAVSLLLNLVELFHLAALGASHRLEKRYRGRWSEGAAPLPQKATPELRAEASRACSTGSGVSVLLQDNPCGSHTDTTVEMSWEPGECVEGERDLLPTYATCMKSLKKVRSPRCHKKHGGLKGKSVKSARRGHSEQTHYV